MKGIILISFLAIITASNAWANVTASDLTKVNAQSQAKCVEYYSYNNEMYCTTKPTLSKDSVDLEAIKSDPQHVLFDNRIWKAAWAKKNNRELTVEYVPDGDDINNWHELVTSQTYYGLKDVTPKQFVDYFLNGLKKQGFQSVVSRHTSIPKLELFEFQIKEPANQEQDVIVAVTSGKDALYILQYATKQFDMGTEKRQIWLKNLMRSKHP